MSRYVMAINPNGSVEHLKWSAAYQEVRDGVSDWDNPEKPERLYRRQKPAAAHTGRRLHFGQVWAIKPSAGFAVWQVRKGAL